MPINLLNEETNVGQVVYLWDIKEYEQHERDRRWYIFATVAAVFLILFGFFTSNYLFVLVIVLFAIVLYVHSAQEPPELSFAITETGIVLGNKYYTFRELGDFWIIYNPPEVKTLYFSLNNFLKHRLQVPLLDNDPTEIQEYLSQYLEENLEKEEEPMSDRVARLFKLN